MSGESKVNVGLTQGSARLEPIVVYRCCGTDKQKDLYKSLWNSKLVALKRESLLNTFADGGLNVVYIRTKI